MSRDNCSCLKEICPTLRRMWDRRPRSVEVSSAPWMKAQDKPVSLDLAFAWRRVPAFPFGGHPTFARYLAWAVQQGCTVQSGVDTLQSINVTKIVAKSGKWVIESGTQPQDFLMPTTVGRLDQRLGLVSP
jgi:hypothetical protein